MKKEFLRRMRKLLETKLCSRSLIKRIDTWAKSPRKILWTILKINKRGTQTNRLKDKKIDEDAKTFISERWYRQTVLYVDLRPGPKILFQGNTPEGSDTFQRPVIERDRVGGLRLMIWDKVKVSLCHYSHAPEESNLWTVWQLFPLDDD